MRGKLQVMLAPLGRALTRYHHQRVHLPRVERVARVFAELLVASPAILDVGSGDGAVGAGVAELLDARVEGVEIAPRPGARIATQPFDGTSLPFEDHRFDAVLLADVLHHSEDPGRLLKECLRVAPRVAVKDHFAFGRMSTALLLAMDRVGNSYTGVEVPGSYLDPAGWTQLVSAAGAKVSALRWPLVIHDLPWRVVTRSELQFAALVERCL